MNSLVHNFEHTHSGSATLTGVVKWFDQSRGFGFVLVPGFDVEFLLHQKVLRKYGRDSAADGAFIEFSYSKQSNGYKVQEIRAMAGTLRSIQYEDIVHPDKVSEDFVPARVKWFDASKGYGFVNCYGSTEDIFIGSSVLKRNGITELTFGQALNIQVCEARGRKRVHAMHDWATPGKS